MTVDIEKLRALCTDVPEQLTVDQSGDVVVGVDGVRAARTGVHPVGSLFPLVLRAPRGDSTTLPVAMLAASARPAILALCDEVERLRGAPALDLAPIKALLAEATPHPLTFEPGSHGRWRITVTVDGHTAEIAHGNDYHYDDGPLFARAREIIAGLVAEVERLRDGRDSARQERSAPTVAAGVLSPAWCMKCGEDPGEETLRCGKCGGLVIPAVMSSRRGEP